MSHPVVGFKTFRFWESLGFEKLGHGKKVSGSVSEKIGIRK